MLITTVTQIEGKDDEKGMKYRFSRIRGSGDSWTVIRWPADHPQIPPVTQTLTVDGWQGILTDHSAALVIREQDFDRAVAVL